jgi:AraC-like DNA-binding protein
MRLEYGKQPLCCGIDRIYFVRVRRNSGFRFPCENGKKKNGFILLHQGKMRYTLLDAELKPIKDIVLETGDVLFIPQGTPYTALYLEDDTAITHAQFDLIYGSLPGVLQEPYRFRLPQSEAISSKMPDAMAPDIPEDSIALWGAYHIYRLMWNAVDSSRKPAKKFKKLLPALEHIKKNYRKQEKIESYARLCRMSESGFRRLFVEYTGLSPVDYRNEIRLSEAKKLIETGEYLVEEAAMEVGFQNISFFCRAYRKKFGHTPLGKE